MSNWTTFYGWFYTQALRLCPRGFRAETSLVESNDIQIEIEERQPGTWGAAFQAGLPHLLMGLLVGLGRWA
jgi:hypothetical protein